MNKSIVIVDPYNSGSRYVPLIKQRGYDCIQVKSTVDRPAGYRKVLNDSDFSATYTFADNVQKLASELSQHSIEIVLAGEEVSVPLADELNELLGLVTNGKKGSLARRHKYRMAEKAKAAGLDVPKQFCSSNLAEIVDWFQENGANKVVIKPTMSSGNEGVQICKNLDEVKNAFHAIEKKTNKLGIVNSGVIIQSFMHGNEYIVDTVSRNGRHKIVAIWEYGNSKENLSVLGHDTIKLIADVSENSVTNQLIEYTRKLLNALEIHHGPAHTELMLTNEGILLVECGARAHGGFNPLLAGKCTDGSQLELTLNAYLQPEAFLKSLNKAYQPSSTALIFFMFPREKGILQSIHGLDDITNAISLHEMEIWCKTGEEVERVIGRVNLLHADEEIVAGDYERLKKITYEISA